MCAHYKAYNSERAWKDIAEWLQVPYYWSRIDHCWKIRSRKIRTAVGKFSFVNKTIADWNRLPEEAIGNFHVTRHKFRKRVREVIIRELNVEMWKHSQDSSVGIATSYRLNFLLLLLLFFSFCITVFLFYILSPYVLIFSFSVTVFFCALFIFYVTLPPGISPITVSNIYIYIYHI
jgi:hypothetical protein